MTVPVLPRLRARTLEAPPQPDLFDLLPPDADPATVVSWVREGDGLIGWGRAASSTDDGMPSGLDRFTAAAQWWADLVEAAEVVDEVNLPGTGLVAFGSFAFSPNSPDLGGLVVPRVVAGQRDGRAWVTSIEALEPGTSSPAACPSPAGGLAREDTDGARTPTSLPTSGRAPESLRLQPGAVTPEAWPDGVIRHAGARPGPCWMPWCWCPS